MVSLPEGTPEAERLLPLAHELLAALDATPSLRAAIREAALPRGRLRAALRAPLAATTSTSTASRRGPTCCAPLGDGDRRRGRASTSRTPSASPAPSSAPSPLAAAASLESGLPFVIVRKEAKEYGTANRLEGVVRAGRARLPRRGRRHRRRRGARGGRGAARGRARVSTAVCVVDREEGGADALARAAVRLRPLFTASELLESRRKSAWLSDIRRRC